MKTIKISGTYVISQWKINWLGHVVRMENEMRTGKTKGWYLTEKGKKIKKKKP